ncbi:UNVERIFIED_CONTAM: RNA polymerase sigma-70 factor (ECF subfamily) [Acetivibrio alkalicellulosi]
MDTDNIMVKEILDGKTESFNYLINKYYTKITAFIIKMNVTREDAQDIAQEVFVKVYNNLYKYNNNWKFSTWLFKVAVNTYKDSKKKKRIKLENINDQSLKAQTFFPDEHIDNLYFKDVIHKMFQSLEDDVRLMIILKYHYEFTFGEIGEIFKKSPEAIKMKVLRTRKKLTQLYEKNIKDGEYNEL